MEGEDVQNNSKAILIDHVQQNLKSWDNYYIFPSSLFKEVETDRGWPSYKIQFSDYCLLHYNQCHCPVFCLSFDNIQTQHDITNREIKKTQAV